MNKTVDELVVQAARKLTDLGYERGTMQRYQASWNKIRRWCSERGIDWFGKEEELQLLEDMGLNTNVLPCRERAFLRHVRVLLSIDETGGLPATSRPAPEPVPERFRQVLDAYASSLERRRLAPVTRRGHISIIRKFLQSLTINDLGDLSMEEVTAHMEACAWMAAQTKALLLYTIRAFTRWAADEGVCSPGIAAAMPIIPGHKYGALPSAYTIDEVAAMVAAVEGECPRRDRAILLLAAVLGLRAGDIRTLRWGDIDWRAREIKFTQAKTGNPVRLPLPEEVMLALADYMSQERPSVADEHVFVHHRAPHHNFKDASISFHHVATAAFGRGSVDTAGKHHGMHSLRHSAATNMLSGGTAYPVISGILGHSNADTTRRYMAIDVEALRGLSLEVPRG